MILLGIYIVVVIGIAVRSHRRNQIALFRDYARWPGLDGAVEPIRRRNAVRSVPAWTLAVLFVAGAIERALGGWF